MRNLHQITVMLFFSDIKQYIPLKLCKSAGSIHLLSDLWTIKFRPDSPREKLPMGHDKKKLERSLCDFEQHYNTNAKIS